MADFWRVSNWIVSNLVFKVINTFDSWPRLKLENEENDNNCHVFARLCVHMKCGGVRVFPNRCVGAKSTNVQVQMLKDKNNLKTSTCLVFHDHVSWKKSDFFPVRLVVWVETHTALGRLQIVKSSIMLKDLKRKHT
jgi:hypothetical protein